MSSCWRRALPVGARTTPPICGIFYIPTASSSYPSRSLRGVFRGAEATIGWFTRELWRWFEEFTSTPEGVIDGGQAIVVPVNVKARARNGKTMDVHNVWIYEFREGKLIRGQVYADTAILRDVVDGVRPA